MASIQHYSFQGDEEHTALEHPLSSSKYIGKITFILFSDFLSNNVCQNGFLSSDINLSDQNGSFDTHIAILCAIFVIQHLSENVKKWHFLKYSDKCQMTKMAQSMALWVSNEPF